MLCVPVLPVNVYAVGVALKNQKKKKKKKKKRKKKKEKKRKDLSITEWTIVCREQR